jgi:glucose-1-phosphate thymidylyltransferase
MKGIVLAGGTGSRLWPVTLGVSKQLLPVYDKPLIHYPISTLMLAGIREMLIITTPRDQEAFKSLLGDGSRYGVRFEFQTQERPEGLAQALTISESFVGLDKLSLILGDNIFYGGAFGKKLRNFNNVTGASIFAYKVRDPERYGVVEFDVNGKATSIEEKPSNPKTFYAVPGLYFYDNDAIEIAKSIKPSLRGELEITEVNSVYMRKGKLNVSVIDRGTAWLDTGTFESLSAAGQFIRIIEERQGQKVSCLEEVAWRNQWINDAELARAADAYKQSPYARYLRELLN